MISRQPELASRAELRQDPVTGKWVIIAPQRAARPQEFDTRPRRIRHGPCPFCPGNEFLTPVPILAKLKNCESSGESSWQVRVVPNKYPALMDCQEMSLNSGIYCGQAAAGCHEVLIETPRHVQSLSELSREEVRDVLAVLTERLNMLKTDRRLQYAMVFKNVGATAGASIEHTHSQIMAIPIIPNVIEQELAGAKSFFDKHHRCIYCRMIEEEMASHDRVVIGSPRFVVICPFASRFPYETWLFPREHAWRFEEMPSDCWDEFIQVVQETIQRTEKTLPETGYNLILHNAPLKAETPFYHWHIELLPSTSRPAGFEWGSGIHINSVFPEFAAQTLREQHLYSG
ncbi:MAG: galactose-1-phosphate uridylyltransferase [Thermogutta sp.]